MKNASRILMVASALLASITATNAQGVWIGPGIPLQNGTIQNMTPLYCNLVARGKKFATIAPGETIYSGARKGHLPVSFRGGFGSYALSQNIQIPIAAICFADAELTHYVGAAVTEFNVPGAGYSSANVWVIHPGDVQPFDKESAVIIKSGPLKSALGLKTAKMPFPGPLASGWGTVQFANNSHYVLTARMIIGGVKTVFVQPAGGIYYVEIPGYREVVIDLKATDPATGNVVGVWHQMYRGQTVDISAQSLILNDNSFRR